ncbi:apolipoprotein N-acyltransferase [Thermocrinis minervae]|uniref:Apolipoprotein N-acyltransferase n=1 Tax=Thermocrinis minervae TaxID=381751 RepID=A0A1M6SY91_9AQUI|nr:apolipoprotein N-acyltransferase [Thermocrinis minervae]SHK49675.1 Apolipoprotein N-acyltransferase [Thermocrinis minervae]
MWNSPAELRSKVKASLFALLAGFSLFLPFSKYELWFTMPVGMFLLLLRKEGYIWLLAGLAFFFLSLECASIPMVKYAGLNPVVAYSLVFFLAFFLSLLQFYFPVRLFKNRDVLLILAFCGIEILRSYFPYGGFPWLISGIVLSYVPVAKYSLYYLTVYGASLVLWFFVLALLGRRFKYALILVLFPFALGTVQLLKLNREYGRGKELYIAVVQTAVPQDVKLNWQSFEKYTPEILAMVKGAVERGAKVILLPETALPLFFDLEDPTIQELYQLSQKSAIVFGIVDLRNSKNKVEPYNSVYLFYKGKVENYDKVRLMPVGEYVPFPFGFLKDLVPAISGLDYQPGKELKPLEVDGVKMATPVCFEIAYWDLVKRLSRDAKLIAVLTNDGWFDDSQCASQHFRWAVVRALENGLPVLWVNNSGYSAYIDHMGNVVKQLPYSKRSILFVHVRIKD